MGYECSPDFLCAKMWYGVCNSVELRFLEEGVIYCKSSDFMLEVKKLIQTVYRTSLKQNRTLWGLMDTVHEKLK